MNYIIMALVITRAFALAATAIIALYLFTFGAHVYGIFYDLKYRVNKDFSKLFWGQYI